MITNEEGIKEPVFPHEHNGQEPAFPEPYINNPDVALSIKPGLTKREYFAGLAMQGLLSNPHYVKDLEEKYKSNVITDANFMLVRESLDMADELLKQLEQ